MGIAYPDDVKAVHAKVKAAVQMIRRELKPLHLGIAHLHKDLGGISRVNFRVADLDAPRRDYVAKVEVFGEKDRGIRPAYNGKVRISVGSVRGRTRQFPEPKAGHDYIAIAASLADICREATQAATDRAVREEAHGRLMDELRAIEAAYWDQLRPPAGVESLAAGALLDTTAGGIKLTLYGLTPARLEAILARLR